MHICQLIFLNRRQKTRNMKYQKNIHNTGENKLPTHHTAIHSTQPHRKKQPPSNRNAVRDISQLFDDTSISSAVWQTWRSNKTICARTPETTKKTTKQTIIADQPTHAQKQKHERIIDWMFGVAETSNKWDQTDIPCHTGTQTTKIQKIFFSQGHATNFHVRQGQEHPHDCF